MMMETKNPMELLTKKLYKFENDLKKLERIEDKRIISSRFRKYCEHLLWLYHCCEEVKIFQNLNLSDRFIKSQVDARIQLDAIGELYFSDSFKSEELRNAYKELYLIGKNEYSKLNETNFGNN